MCQKSTLLSCFHQTCKSWPEQGIVVGGNHYSFRELDQQSERLASGLYHKGVRSGDVIAICVPNGIELVLLHLAVFKLGGIVLPLNPRYTPHELSFILNDASAVAFFFHDRPPSEIEPLKNMACTLRLCVDVSESNVFQRFFDASPDFPLSQHQENDIACICYTSGTTGTPKGACLSHRNICFDVRTLLNYWEVTHNDRFLLVLPMFHVHGLMLGLYGCFMFGHTTWILPSFAPEQVITSLLEFQATMFMGVPTIYQRMIQSPSVKRLRFSEMRLFTSGSAPLSEEIFNRFTELTGHTIVERYGLTETVINTSNPYNGEKIPGTVGVPLPGVDIKIVVSQGVQVEDDTIGEIYVKGPNVFQGYLNRPDATQASFKDGWFATGDLGKIRNDGYLQIVGRIKELIISGGYNVYPNEVEQVIQQFPGITEVAVIGVPDKDFGETVHAVVVLEKDAEWSEDQLKQESRKFLAFYKIPRSFRFVDKLPRNALGKIQKHLL